MWIAARPLFLSVPAGQGGKHKKINKGTPDKSSRNGCVLSGVFYCSGKGQAIRRNCFFRLYRRTAPAGCRGSRNGMLSPGKGDNMAIKRAGSRFTPAAGRYHIFSVHTAAFFKGAAAPFYPTYFCLFQQQITKEYSILISGAPDTFTVRFFCALKGVCLPLPGARAPPSGLETV